MQVSPHGRTEDKAGFWAFDRVHAPRPLTPLSQDLLLPAFGDGMTAGLREIGYAHAIAMRATHEYAYLSVVENAAHGSALEKLFDLHLRALSDVLPKLGAVWSEKWLRSILPGLERLRTLEYATLSCSELFETLAELRVDLVGRWRIHGLILPVYLSASRFEEFYRAEFDPEDPTEAYSVLHGFRTRAWASSRALWSLSRHVLQLPGVAEVFATAHTSHVEQMLRQSVVGQTSSRNCRRIYVSLAGGATPSSNWPIRCGGKSQRARSPRFRGFSAFQTIWLRTKNSREQRGGGKSFSR